MRAVRSRLPSSPESRNGTRDRLLDAAERLYAARGFRATSVRAITAEAGCNVAAVNYYFGGKTGLYREMFRRRLGALREQRIWSIRRAMIRAGEGASLELPLRAFTMSFLEPHLDESGGRRWMKLISRELLDPHLAPGTFQREMVEPVQKALTDAIRPICRGLDARSARRCFHSLVAQLVHVVQMRHAPGAARGGHPDDFALAAVVDHIVRFSAAGFRAHFGLLPLGGARVLGEESHLGRREPREMRRDQLVAALADGPVARIHQDRVERLANALGQPRPQQRRAVAHEARRGPEPDPDAPKERNFVQPGFLESQPYSAWAPKFVASLGDYTRAAKRMNEAYVQGLRAITGTVDLKTAMIELSKAIGRRLFIIFEDYALSDLESE